MNAISTTIHAISSAPAPTATRPARSSPRRTMTATAVAGSPDDDRQREPTEHRGMQRQPVVQGRPEVERARRQPDGPAERGDRDERRRRRRRRCGARSSTRRRGRATPLWALIPSSIRRSMAKSPNSMSTTPSARNAVVPVVGAANLVTRRVPPSTGVSCHAHVASGSSRTCRPPASVAPRSGAR